LQNHLKAHIIQSDAEALEIAKQLLSSLNNSG
jgi:hypothetical protein